MQGARGNGTWELETEKLETVGGAELTQCTLGPRCRFLPCLSVSQSVCLLSGHASHLCVFLTLVHRLYIHFAFENFTSNCACRTVDIASSGGQGGSVQDQGRSSTSGVYLWVSLAAWRSFKCQTLCSVAGAALAKVTVQRHMWRLALVANGNCGKQQQLTHNDFLPCNLKFMLKSCYSDRVVGGSSVRQV